MNYAIGIDLGTTYSCVGVYRNNTVEIIPNELSERTTPSVVSFTEYQRLIGNPAKSQITKNYKNTIYDAKRLIGRNFNDENVQKDIKLYPFKVDKDNKNKPIIEVEYEKKIQKFYPEQISSMILEKLKGDAEKYLEGEVKDAVITVPAYFNNEQRQATIDAGRIAGLNVIKIINEPTAAAIAYGLNINSDNKKKICVFDLGGGTFDVTIMEINNKNFVVKATGGNSHLGGQDFDNELVKFCIEKFKEENGIDISNDQKALRRLKVACEKVKIELSSLNDSIIDIDSLSNGINFNIVINRSDFEFICKPYFEKCMRILRNTINKSPYSKNLIEDIILVGGSTRIPKIQSMLKEFFDDKKQLLKTINADEAVAYGASIEAALNNKDTNQYEGLDQLVLIDVCPLSLGTSVIGGKMDVLIKRNTIIPCENTKNYVTVNDFQKSICVDVYEGEREFCNDNIELDKFHINNIKKSLKGKVSVKVTFKLDNNSILQVSAFEEGNENNSGNITIKREKRSDEEIEKMIQDGKRMRNIDLERRKRIDTKLSLEDYLYEITKQGNYIYMNNKKIIEQKVKEVKNWMKSFPNEEVEVYKKKIEEIKNFISKL